MNWKSTASASDVARIRSLWAWISWRSRLLVLGLATILQWIPVQRALPVLPGAVRWVWSPTSPWAVVGVVASLGTVDAVAGASAGVSGLTEYSGSTVVGSPTNHVVHAVGQAFKYRITVRNPGSDFLENYFNCVPLPPGLTIDTRLGAAGYIVGTPTVPGVYPVTLFAGNVNYPEPATAGATIVIVEPSAAPSIVEQPRDLALGWQGSGLLSVSVTGSEPLTYRWFRNGLEVEGGVNAVLPVVATTLAVSGTYQAVISNAAGSVTSQVAQVVVQQPLNVPFKVASVTKSGETMFLEVTGPFLTNYVMWASSDLVHWASVETNWVMDGLLKVQVPVGVGAGGRFHRFSTSGGE